MRAVRGGVCLLLLGFAVGSASAAPMPMERYRLTLERVPSDVGEPGVVSALLRQLRLRAVGVYRPKPGTRFRVTAVAYSSSVDQTDLSPCVTAWGTRVRRGIVATNFLPFGTRLRIGDDVVVVEDRMNERYNGQYIIDIWHPTREEARVFGSRVLEVEVLGDAAPALDDRAAPDGSPVPDMGETAVSRGGFIEGVTERLRRFRDRVRLLLPVRVMMPEDIPCPTGPAP